MVLQYTGGGGFSCGVTLYTGGGGGVTVVVTLRRWWWLQLWCYSGVTLDTGGGQWERRS